MPTKKTSSVQLSIDLDKLIRDEATEWFTSNRKDLEVVIQRVADRVREELEGRIRELEEEVKRMRSVLVMVRSQVVEEVVAQD